MLQHILPSCISRTQMIIHIILGWFSLTAADLFFTSYQAWVWPPWSTVQSRPRNKDLNLKTDLSDSWKQRQPRSALTCPSVDLVRTVLCGRKYIFSLFQFVWNYSSQLTWQNNFQSIKTIIYQLLCEAHQAENGQELHHLLSDLGMGILHRYDRAKLMFQNFSNILGLIPLLILMFLNIRILQSLQKLSTRLSVKRKSSKKGKTLFGRIIFN